MDCCAVLMKFNKPFPSAHGACRPFTWLYQLLWREEEKKNQSCNAFPFNNQSWKTDMHPINISAPLENRSGAFALMNEEKTEWLTSLAGRKAVRQKVILHVEPSDLDAGVHFKPAWGEAIKKKSFLHFKVLLPAASQAIFRKIFKPSFSERKTTSEPTPRALETFYPEK